MDFNDALMGGGVRSAKFESVGDIVKGTIARDPEITQQRDVESGEALSWPDGNPKQQLKIVLATDERADDDDNGERALYVKLPSAMQAAIRDAVKKAGAKGLQVGGKLAVKHTGVAKPTKRGLNGAKQFAASYEAPVVSLETPASAAGEAEPQEDDADLKF